MPIIRESLLTSNDLSAPQVQQADGRWVLIGLVSAGFSCGKPGQPGIYHRISATSDWITKQAYNHLFF